MREPAVLAALDKPHGSLDAPWLAEASLKLAARSDRGDTKQPSGLDALFEALKAAGPLRSPSKAFDNPAFAVRGCAEGFARRWSLGERCPQKPLPSKILSFGGPRRMSRGTS